jgi:hypothetical protein
LLYVVMILHHNPGWERAFMTTIRVAKRDRFTIVDRRAITDDRLSFRALGLLVWLLDKPDDWRVDAERMCNERREGRDAIRTACRELIDAGYMVKTKSQDKRGRWSTTITVHESPARTDDGFPVVGNPTVGEPGANTKTEYEEPSLAQLPLSVRVHFDEFWAVWPKRVAKRAAQKAYERAVKRESPDVILKGAQRVAAAWVSMPEEQRKFVPYPERWLNADRWADVPDEEGRPAKPKVIVDPDCPHCFGDGWVTVEGTNDMRECECRRVG